MIDVSDEVFEELIADAMDSLPKQFEKVKNVAIVLEDEPTQEQRARLHLHDGVTLYGLYEGVPLPRRQGATNLLPDKITLFKKPLSMHVSSVDELRGQIRRTLWHELAHYYGLDHTQIRALE